MSQAAPTAIVGIKITQAPAAAADSEVLAEKAELPGNLAAAADMGAPEVIVILQPAAAVVAAATSVMGRLSIPTTEAIVTAAAVVDSWTSAVVVTAEVL